MSILSLGTLHYDRVYHLPQTIHPTLSLETTLLRRYPGGQGLFQSLVCKRAGAEVFHCARLGEEGIPLKTMLELNGVDTRLILEVNEVNSHALILLDPSGNSSEVLFQGSHGAFTAEEIDRTLAEYASLSQNEPRLLLMQNESNLTQYTFDRAKHYGIKVAYHPSPILEDAANLDLSSIDYLLGTQRELLSLLNLSEDTPASDLFRSLHEKAPKAQLIVTFGQNGSWAYDQEKSYRFGIYPTSVIDRTGVQNCFIGYYLVNKLQGKSTELALTQATAAASLSLSKTGGAVVAPSPHEVDIKISEQEALKWNSKEGFCPDLL